ncbi:cation transporter [Actinomadura sp. KC216]|uniref:Na+/H+ antiporter subunit E n=1 Tax=Actinomadura sp. KC216 TaxID=2530370 RepID=UPI001044930F|nr:Na+/H+ antiporter subunit E [Actinomadura sp. KC216]TDB88949.1 cation transporter [Actinomadura sp. KC216]
MSARNARDSRRRATALQLVPLLVAFWLVISGHYTPLLLILGAFSVVLVVWVVLRMAVIDEESLPLRLVPRLPRYLLWLGGQILLSALTVVRLVWSPRRRPRPVVGTMPTTGLSDMSKVVYANSITLTPGTLSVSFREEDIEVHSIHQEGLTELEGGAMLDRVTRLEAR